MTRSLLVALAIAAASVAACGKYGPPRRTGQAPPARQASEPSPIPPIPPTPPLPMGSEGTSILDPTSEPLPPPTAPSEEPEATLDDPEEELEP